MGPAKDWTGLDAFLRRSQSGMRRQKVEESGGVNVQRATSARGRFRGRFEAKIDPKGRLSLPASLRDALSPPKRRTELRLIVTNGLYQNKHCLHAYSAEAWRALEERVEALPRLKPEVQAFERFYLSGAQAIDLDAQGRLLVPAPLRKRAGLEAEATLVGMGEKFEIWDSRAWNEVNDALALAFEGIEAAIAQLEERRP